LLAETAKKETVAQSFGYVGAASSLGTVIAPVLGGAVYHSVGYYPVFAMCFAFLGLDILLRLAVIEKKTAVRWLQTDDTELSAPDPAGQDSTVSHDVEGAPSPIPSPQQQTQAQAQFQARPQNSTSKGLPAIFKLWKSPRVLAAFWGDFVTATVMVAFDTTLALFVSRTFHWSSLQAGLTFLALLLPTFFGPVFGFLADKYGSRWISAAGFIFMGPPLILLRFVTHESVGQIVLLCALLLLVGLGSAMALSGLYAEYSKVCDDIEAEQPGSLGANGGYAQSYGISEIAWALAGLISPLMSGGIYESASWGTLGWALSVFCFLTVIPTLLFVNR
jgi:MFS family permease